MNRTSPFPARHAPLLTGLSLFLMAGVARPADATAVFHEAMYHPVVAAAPEWVEFRNVLSVNLDLSGWKITGGVDYVFPEGTVIPAGGILVVSSAAGNPPSALGPWTGSLANEGETIRLRNRNGGIVDELAYNDAGDWPVGADGSGSTVAKLPADTASADPASWRVSAQTGGTPGTDNFPVPPSAPGIVLNEMAPAGPGFFVELRNAGTAAVEVGGMILSASDGSGSYVLPAGLLAPGALQSFGATALGFSPPASARLFLFAPGQAALLDAQRLRSTGQARSGDGGQWLVPAGPTPGSPNTFLLHEALIISEIHYHPRTVPAFPGAFADHVFADFGNTWRYEASGTDLGTAWRQPSYVDTAWTTGTATFEGPAGQSYITAVQTAAPIAYWRLGENPATGTAVDASSVSGTQNGTYANAVAQAGLIAGDANDAVMFSGTSQVSGGGLTGVFANDWTIEAWFTHTAQAEWSGIFSNNGAAGNSGAPLMTFIENSNLLGINGAGITVNNVAVNLGADHFGKKIYAVITKTGGNATGTNTITVRAWIEGVEVPSATGTSAWTIAPRSSWYIGRHWADAAQYHRGAIDEVAVYNRALSASEITEHERSGRIAPGTALPTGVTTTYFRRSFNFTGNPAQTELTLKTAVDDGAVFYLWIDVREIRRADTGAVLEAEWTSENTWWISLALLNGANGIALRAFDHQGAQVGTDNITITSTLNAPLPRDFLRVTELHYHPAPPTGTELAVSTDKDDFEFIELRNTGLGTLDISGCSITEGMDFVFPANTTLTGGGSIIVVRSVAAFQSRYGPGLRIAGDYGPADALKNSGETITLLDATGALIQSFTYSDAWFPATDGGGRSMIVRNESAALSAWNSAAQWGISTQAGGTPATTNSGEVAWQFEGWRQTWFSPTQLADPLISGPAAGVAGISNQLRYALGLTPFEATAALLTGANSGDSFIVQYRRRKNLLDVQFTIESTANFDIWTPLTAPAPAIHDNNDGTETVIVTDTAPFPAGGRRFLHLRVALQPLP